MAIAEDTMMSVRETPWMGQGVVLEKNPSSIDEAVKLAGLDWEVQQKTIYIANGEVVDDEDFEVDPVEGFYANVREDTGKALGIVTSRYKTVPNREAFSFLSSIFGTEMMFETAGSFMQGRRVWVLMKIPSWIEVGGDRVDQYALVSNSHDGKSSVLLAVTPLRVVCQNMLPAAMRNAKRSYTIRHLGNPSAKLAEAQQALEVTVNYYEQFKVMGDRLATVKISDRRAKKMIESLIPIPEDLGDRALRNREEARTGIMHLFKNGTVLGDLSTKPENAPDTLWALYNAATEYADWYRSERKAGGRFQRAIDDPDSFKQNAWQICVEAA